MKIFIDGSEIRSEADFHKKIAEAMEFPPHYGENLDALWDVLSTDIERPVTLIWGGLLLQRSLWEMAFSK